jgi:hypothetical protein
MQRALLPVLATVLATVLARVLGAAGCKPGAAEAPEAPPEEARIGQRCPTLSTPERIDVARARVFVEVAHVTTTDLPSPLGSGLEGRALPVRSVASFVATSGVPTGMPWGECLDEACDGRAARWALSLVLPPAATEPLQLTMQLREPPPAANAAAESDGSEAAPPLFETTLALRSQEPSRVPAAQVAVGDGALVVTAYVLGERDDFFKLLRCKADQVGTREIRPLRASPPP